MVEIDVEIASSDSNEMWLPYSITSVYPIANIIRILNPSDVVRKIVWEIDIDDKITFDEINKDNLVLHMKSYHVLYGDALQLVKDKDLSNSILYCTAFQGDVGSGCSNVAINIGYDDAVTLTNANSDKDSIKYLRTRRCANMSKATLTKLDVPLIGMKKQPPECVMLKRSSLTDYFKYLWE